MWDIILLNTLHPFSFSNNKINRLIYRCMRTVIRTSDNNSMPIAIYKGDNIGFRRKIFNLINEYVSYGYIASWTKDHIILSRDKEVIYLYILDYVTQSPRLTIKQKVNKIKTNKYND
jgi:hypothetical protein